MLSSAADLSSCPALCLCLLEFVSCCVVCACGVSCVSCVSVAVCQLVLLPWWWLVPSFWSCLVLVFAGGCLLVVLCCMLVLCLLPVRVYVRVCVCLLAFLPCRSDSWAAVFGLTGIKVVGGWLCAGAGWFCWLCVVVLCLFFLVCCCVCCPLLLTCLLVVLHCACVCWCLFLVVWFVLVVCRVSPVSLWLSVCLSCCLGGGWCLPSGLALCLCLLVVVSLLFCVVCLCLLAFLPCWSDFWLAFWGLTGIKVIGGWLCAGAGWFGWLCVVVFCLFFLVCCCVCACAVWCASCVSVSVCLLFCLPWWWPVPSFWSCLVIVFAGGCLLVALWCTLVLCLHPVCVCMCVCVCLPSCLAGQVSG